MSPATPATATWTVEQAPARALPLSTASPRPPPVAIPRSTAADRIREALRRWLDEEL